MQVTDTNPRNSRIVGMVCETVGHDTSTAHAQFFIYIFILRYSCIHAQFLKVCKIEVKQKHVM
jgi:hypothetical protein